MDNKYNKEITTASFQELIEFAKWSNKVYGNYPIIIGGWAVHSYTKGLGSRDIDIVFPNRQLKHEVLINFFKARNYKEEGVFSKTFFKEVEMEHAIEKIYIDACSLEDKNYLKDNERITLPWKLTVDHSNKIQLENNVFIYIPKIEVLVLYKIKALLDRQHDLRKEGTNSYLESKIWKDKEDIASLIKVNNFDKKLLKKLLEDRMFKEYFISGLKQVSEDAFLLAKHKLLKEDIEQLITL